MEGGYIYGNTIAAVTRTLNRGIPGSAMPSFADSLTEHERGLLARHVLSLGPESTDASPAECLVPTPDRPEVLDGPLMIPGLPASAPVGDVGLHPSRLMIFPGGPSVQFARGNWDPIAIRAQGPVSRDDWRRGGRSITARGEVLWRRTAPDAVDPGSLVNLEGGMPASKRLQRTQMDGRSITQVFRVGSPDGSARLSERVRPVTFGDDAVIVRVLELTGDEAVTFAEPQDLSAGNLGRVRVEGQLVLVGTLVGGDEDVLFEGDLDLDLSASRSEHVILRSAKLFVLRGISVCFCCSSTFL